MISMNLDLVKDAEVPEDLVVMTIWVAVVVAVQAGPVDNHPYRVVLL
jgi:hypothetical protein